MKGGDLLFITAFRVFSGAVTLKFFLEEWEQAALKAM